MSWFEKARAMFPTIDWSAEPAPLLDREEQPAQAQAETQLPTTQTARPNRDDWRILNQQSCPSASGSYLCAGFSGDGSPEVFYRDARTNERINVDRLDGYVFDGSASSSSASTTRTNCMPRRFGAAIARMNFSNGRKNERLT
jgi:hypothetical protein